MGNSKTKPEQSNSKESNDNDTSNTSNPPNTSIYPQLQIRNCIRNVRNNSSNFAEMFPNEAGASCGQNRSSVYTIDVHNSTPVNFTNPGYVATEGKTPSNDGLPTYEEAISGVKTPISPIAPSAPQPRPTIEVVSEDSSNAASSRGRRHRHRRHHRHHHHETDGPNENTEPSTVPEESRRHHRRGNRLRKHLAKINRKHRPETE